jgi:hypothetical protein
VRFGFDRVLPGDGHERVLDDDSKGIGSNRTIDSRARRIALLSSQKTGIRRGTGWVSRCLVVDVFVPMMVMVEAT